MSNLLLSDTLHQSFYDIIDTRLVPSMINLAFYGGYLVLYGICIHIIIKRKKEGHLINGIIITMLFLVATLGLVLNIVAYMLEAKAKIAILTLNEGSEFHGRLMESSALIHHGAQIVIIIANMLTDGILIRRCYLVWNRSCLVTIPLVLACAANNILGIVNVFLAPLRKNFVELGASRSKTLERGRPVMSTQANLLLSFVAGSIVTNVILTVLIAGRIIYIRREVEHVSTSSTQQLYRTLVSAILESGLLYPFILILYGSFMLGNWFYAPQDMSPLTVAAEVCYSILLPAMGISSTFIVVRTTLGIAVQNQESFRSSVPGEIGQPSVIQFCQGMSDGCQGIEGDKKTEGSINSELQCHRSKI